MSTEVHDFRARAAAIRSNSRNLLRDSRWLITSSCERLLGRRHRIGGGADVPDEASIRERVRVLLYNGVLPGVRANEIRVDRFGQHDCTICGVGLGVGEVGFKLPSLEGVAVVVHRRCFDLWTQEAALRSAGGAR